MAWGATGHEWVSGIAAELLPEELPAFLRLPEVAPEIAVLGRELDRSKGAGETHDRERDPGHYIDLDDAGLALGTVPLDRLPATREQYDTQLRARGHTQYEAGYLPYAMVDGFQQLRKDFAYWRAAVLGAETAASPEERAEFEADRRLREKLIVHDIGIWSHYVGDASQPLHVTIHYNGWTGQPNPAGYTTDKIHAHVEGAFVAKNLARAAVKARVVPYADCTCTVQERTRTLIARSLAQVVPLYALHKDGGFRAGDPRGIAFDTDRLAAGAQALRDLVVDAWRASADAAVGYPMVNLRDLASGKAKATRLLMRPD